MRGVTILGLAVGLTFLTGASARITSSATCGAYCSDFGPAWSPDGRTIAFVHNVRGANGPRQTIYVVPAAGGRERPILGLADLYPATPNGPIGPFSGIRWSPNSALVAVRNDLLNGGGGPDFLQGGSGNDVIHGGPATTAFTAGRAAICCGATRRTTRSGRATVARTPSHCGTGRDAVHGDRHDIVASDCEVLYRS